MNNLTVFKDVDNNQYTVNDITSTLTSIGAHDCDVLFVHTDISFGIPNPLLKRKGYLECLFKSIENLGVRTLVFPSFTYSFCNNEVFDVKNSKTSMGALIEYIRTNKDVVRSIDPLLSFITIGKNKNLFDGDLGNNSLGEGSAFDRLHNTEGVKFLFFGAEFEEYFTYVHYVEKMLNVPYRFDKSFSGKIIDYNGKVYDDQHYIHTQCGGVKLKNYAQMKSELIIDGTLKAKRLGNLEVVTISEKDAYSAIYNRITNNINSFVEPFSQKDLTHQYTFGRNGERVTHC